MIDPNRRLVEIIDTDIANQLALTGDWCEAIWSEKRNAWMMKKKAGK